MNGPYLKTGTLTEFKPFGHEGYTLYGAAAQLRETIARLTSSDNAAHFAIPEQNSTGDVLDWYAPDPGPVTGWLDMRSEQRVAVEKRLAQLRQEVALLSETLAQSKDKTLKAYGRLLAHAGTIPDSSHIFLVGERLVLTFWGFRSNDNQSRNTATRGDDQAPYTLVVEPSNAGAKTPTAKRWQKFQPSESASRAGSPPTPPAQSKAEPAASARKLPLRWLVSIVLGILAVGLLWWVWQQKQPEASGEITETLVIPTEKSETESLRFLTGHWQAASDMLIDSVTRSPLSFAYELEGDKGKMLVTKSDGTECSAPVDAMLASGTLILKSRTPIICPSGTSYAPTTMTCRVNADGQTLCNGTFPDGKKFRVDMRRREASGRQ